MGGAERADGEQDELPQHVITLSGYFIARYEVTVGQFEAYVKDADANVADDNRRRWPSDRGPVTYVSWDEALAYANWLDRKLKAWRNLPDGLATKLRGTSPSWRVTLPSEAEWEKAASGNEGLVYPWGNEWDATKATIDRRVADRVGLRPAGRSPYGLFDMAGNVMEWTRSLYKPYPYQPTDGRENLNERGSRVARGGSFYGWSKNVRAAVRVSLGQDHRSDEVGFRLAISPVLD